MALFQEEDNQEEKRDNSNEQGAGFDGAAAIEEGEDEKKPS